MSKILFNLLFIFSAFTAYAQHIYNVLDYGAVGNGSTDDAVAIQRAIDECSTNGGGTVLLPSQHTFLSGPIRP